jgi:hypothetical protein
VKGNNNSTDGKFRTCGIEDIYSTLITPQKHLLKGHICICSDGSINSHSFRNSIQNILMGGGGRGPWGAIVYLEPKFD